MSKAEPETVSAPVDVVTEPPPPPIVMEAIPVPALIVSNPPYIATGEIGRLAPEVRDHDPRLALDGGTDGLDIYRAIAGDARRLLAERGRLIVELGQGQSDAVQALFTQAGLSIEGEPRRDLSGINRALSASTS